MYLYESVCVCVCVSYISSTHGKITQEKEIFDYLIQGKKLITWSKGIKVDYLILGKEKLITLSKGKKSWLPGPREREVDYLIQGILVVLFRLAWII